DGRGLQLHAVRRRRAAVRRADDPADPTDRLRRPTAGLVRRGRRPGMSLLSLRGVRKVYGENVVLDGLALDVAAGECVVLIGASGSGKSTLLRCVNLAETVDDGVVERAGAGIRDPRVD